MLPGTGSPAALAVLPFANLSADHDFDHFAEAFTRELAVALRRLPGVRVAPRASSAALADRSRDPVAIAEALRVQTVLDGRARRSARQVAVDAELVRAATGARLWSGHFTRPAGEVLAVQRAISDAVARELQLPVAVAVRARTPHADAYDLYLRGRGVTGTGRAALERSLEYFERAVAIDPEFGSAQAALAGAAVAGGLYGYQPFPGLAPRIRAAVALALDAGAGEAEARLALAVLALLVDWDLETAARELQAAATAAPDESDALRWQAWLEVLRGRADAAVEIGRRAVAIDPFSAAAHSALAFVHVWLRQPAQALAAGEAAVAADATSVAAHRALGAAHLIAGDPDSARPEADQAVLLSRRHQWALADLAAVCVQLNDRQAAEALHAELLRRSPHEYVQRVVLAQTNAALGQLEDAFKLLDQGAHLREPLPFVRLSPYFDGVRDHPRFQGIFR